MRQFDPEKDKQWRKVLKEWQASGLSLSAFGRRENIKLNTLCTWREIIARRDAAMAAERNQPAKNARARRPKNESAAGLLEPAEEDFVPVVLTGPDPKDIQHVAEYQAKAALEITFANGVNMLVHEHCSPALLATVMELMETAHV